MTANKIDTAFIFLLFCFCRRLWRCVNVSQGSVDVTRLPSRLSFEHNVQMGHRLTKRLSRHQFYLPPSVPRGGSKLRVCSLRRFFGSCILWGASIVISVDISVDASVDTSVATRSILDRCSTDARPILDQCSTDARPILDRCYGEMSLEYRPMHRPLLGRYLSV